MKKLAIIVDSFSSCPKDVIDQKKDYYYLALKIIIDGKEYLESIDESAEKLMSHMNQAKSIKTSQPSPATIEELFTSLSKQYENVIYLPIGTALSGTYQTAKMIAQDFDNVYLIQNTLVGEAFFELGDYLLKNSNDDIKDLVEFANEYGSKNTTYIIPKNIDAFIRGGRLSKTIAFVLEKFKAVPIISYEDNEKLHKKMVKRSGSKAYNWVIDKIEKTLETLQGKWIWNIEHTLNTTFASQCKTILEKKGYQVNYSLTSALINAHTGDGAFSVGIYRKLI